MLPSAKVLPTSPNAAPRSSPARSLFPRLMDTQILSKSVERSDAPVLQQYSSSRSSVARSPRPSRSSLAGSGVGSGGGGSDGGSGGGIVVLHQPMQRLSRYLGLLNRTCGAVLVLTGGWAAFNALRSFDWPEVLGAVLLSFYVSGSGAMLLRYELAGDRSARDVAFRRDYGFLYSHAGRTGFCLLCANLAWACAPCPEPDIPEPKATPEPKPKPKPTPTPRPSPKTKP